MMLETVTQKIAFRGQPHKGCKNVHWLKHYKELQILYILCQDNRCTRNKQSVAYLYVTPKLINPSIFSMLQLITTCCLLTMRNLSFDTKLIKNIIKSIPVLQVKIFLIFLFLKERCNVKYAWRNVDQQKENLTLSLKLTGNFG